MDASGDLRARIEEGATKRRSKRLVHRRARSIWWKRLGLFVVVVIAATVSLRTWVIEPFWIPSESMEPTLHGCVGCKDDRLLVNKLAYKLHDPRRGDIVVFRRPANFSSSDQDLVKRVIGLPGETVSGHDGLVWIGDRPLTEPYVSPNCHGTGDFPPVVVPAKDVFVMGDNRCNSSDSRVFGPIPQSSIVGRAFVTFWPFGRLHWL
ncbi:MAG: signal peptidase I [Actinomycetia bacterium]|nr:signal peptidase I [Actinomycetes bacterium]